MENQQAAVDKSLPGVQARCAVFFILSKNQRTFFDRQVGRQVGRQVTTAVAAVVRRGASQLGAQHVQDQPFLSFLLPLFLLIFSFLPSFLTFRFFSLPRRYRTCKTSWGGFLFSFSLLFSFLFFSIFSFFSFLFLEGTSRARLAGLAYNLIRVHFISNSHGNFFYDILEKKIRELPLNLIRVHFISNSHAKFFYDLLEKKDKRIAFKFDPCSFYQ